MFGIGETEFVIILIFGFLLFGPDKLPGIGRTIGRVLRQFREASEGFTEVVQTNVIDPATQELNNAGSNKRTPAAAQRQQPDPDDEDADIEVGTDATGKAAEPARKRETFAERKARLEAERKAQEAAAAAAVSDGDDEDADVVEGGTTSQTTEVATDASASPEPEAAVSPSVADLYARGSRRSSRAQAEDAEAAAKAETAVKEDAEAEAPDSSTEAPSISTDELDSGDASAHDETNDEGEGDSPDA